MTFFAFAPCSVCGGSRLNARARAVKIHGISLGEAAMMGIGRLKQFFNSMEEGSANPVLELAARIPGDERPPVPPSLRFTRRRGWYRLALPLNPILQIHYGDGLLSGEPS